MDSMSIVAFAKKAHCIMLRNAFGLPDRRKPEWELNIFY